MSKMNQNLVIPEGCIELDLEQMREIEGGFYISNKLITSIVMGCCLNPIGATLAGIGLYKLAGLITAKSAVIGAKLGAVGGPIGSAVGALVSATIGGGAAMTIAKACIEGKGIAIEPAYIGGTKIPYRVDISIR